LGPLGRARPKIDAEARSLVIERWLARYRVTDDSAQIVCIVDGARDRAGRDGPRMSAIQLSKILESAGWKIAAGAAKPPNMIVVGFAIPGTQSGKENPSGLHFQRQEFHSLLSRYLWVFPSTSLRYKTRRSYSSGRKCPPYLNDLLPGVCNSASKIRK
jgi:hypothetical protein